MYIRAVILIAGVLALGILAGCGGGSDDSAGGITGGGTEGSATETGTASEGGNSSSGESASESGSQGDEPDLNEAKPGESTATRDAFLRGANAICRQIGSRMARESTTMIAKASAKGKEAAAFVTAVNKLIVPGLEEELEGLSGLSVPVPEQPRMKEVLTGYDITITKAKANPSKFGHATSPYSAIEKPANILGLTTCPI